MTSVVHCRRPGHGSRPSGLKALAVAAALALLAVAAPAGGALAQTSIRISDSDGPGARAVQLGLGKSIIVELPRDAKEVFVANPLVANAVVRSARKVFVIALAAGQTSLFFMDAAGAQIGALDINVQRDVNPIRAAIKSALPDSDVQVQQLNDGVLLTGTVASAGAVAQAVTIAGKYIGKDDGVANSLAVRSGDQVMLKVTVSEVQRQVLKQLGVDLTGQLTSGATQVSGALNNPFSLNSSLREAADGAITFGQVGSGNLATLQAFERTGVLKTLAEPTLTAISGEGAKFLAGGEIPTPQGCSQNSTGTGCTLTYVYKPIGVSLNFTPVVVADGRISLHVETEVTDLDNQNNLVVRISGTSLTIPAFKVRRASTTVELPSGGSLVMAGMIQSSMRQSVNGTPGLMNIPILGQLFRSRDYQRNETELMIMVTPYLAKTVNAADVAMPTDGFVDASDPSAWLLGRVNRIYGSSSAVPPGPAAAGHYGFTID